MRLLNTPMFSYSLALVFALLVHVGVVAVMSVNWNDTTISHQDVRPYYIEAAVVGENPYTAATNKKKAEADNRLQKKLNDRRQVEAQLRREQADWEQQRKNRPTPAPAPLVKPVQQVAISQAEPETSSMKPDAETVRDAFAEAINAALAQEDNARKAVTDDEKALAYVAQIQREIVQQWSRPPSARNGMQAILRVRLIPTGEVIDVKVEESSGNDAFDRSAVLAVSKAERFLVPADALRFERDFREFTVLFRPDDLRL